MFVLISQRDRFRGLGNDELIFTVDDRNKASIRVRPKDTQLRQSREGNVCGETGGYRLSIPGRSIGFCSLRISWSTE